MTKIQSFVAVCLVALFIVYCGATALALAYTAPNMNENALLNRRSPFESPTTRPGPIALGDPINDPRPHQS